MTGVNEMWLKGYEEGKAEARAELDEVLGELQSICAFGERMPWVREDQQVILRRAQKARAILAERQP